MAHANSASESLFPSTIAAEFPAMVKRLETLKDADHESFHSQRHVMETICSSDQYSRSVFKPNLQQQTKDRYTNIHPSTDYRVKLKVVNNDPCTDYINASWFQSTLPGAATRYIATQAPIPASFPDFWRMVWEYDVGVILMLTSFVENDKKKADKYWPDDSKDELSFGEGETLTRVGLTSTQNVTASIFLRQFAVKRGSDSKNVWHIHYTGWPDHGAPRDNQFEEVVQLLKLYREKRATLKASQPVIFHCSAGVGRNGTFQTIDTILDNLASNNALPINVFNAWLELRVARPGSIQTLDQYKFVFKFIAYCIEKELFGVKTAKKT